MSPTALSSFAAVAAASLSFSASAAVIAGWSVAAPIPSGTVGVGYSIGAADLGEATGGTNLSASHALAATVYSTPAGNGSSYSFNTNNWSAGDYYQASLSTAGYSNISVSWDQTRSSTGPSSFELLVSTDGGASFTSVSAYTVLLNGNSGAGIPSWNGTTGSAAYSFSSALAGAGDAGAVLVRFRCVAPGSGTGGTNRIDNIVVSGNLVPAPGAIALLGVAGLVGTRRRR